MPRRSETFGADSCGCGIKITYGYDGEVEGVDVVRHCGECECSDSSDHGIEWR